MSGALRQVEVGFVGVLFVCFLSCSLTLGQGSPPLNIDHNENGAIDAILLDTDENGLYDGARLDVDEDGRFDVQLTVVDGTPSIQPSNVQIQEIDLNDDGIPEQVTIDLDGDEISELALIDQDNHFADGIVDKIAVNTDDDGVWSFYKATGEFESVKVYLVVCMPEEEGARYKELLELVREPIWEVQKALGLEQWPVLDFDTAIKALHSIIEPSREILLEFHRYPEVVDAYRTIVSLEEEALSTLERAAELYEERYDEFVNLLWFFWDLFNQALPLYHYIQICRAEVSEHLPRRVFVTAEKFYATGAGALVPHSMKGIDRFLHAPETPAYQPYGLVLRDASDWVAYHVIADGSVSQIRLCLANPHIPLVGTRVSVYVHSDPATPPNNVKPPCHDLDPANLLGCTGQPRWEGLGTVTILPPGDWRIYSIQLDTPLEPGSYLIIIRLDEPHEELQEGSNEVWIAWLELIEH